MPTMPKLNNTVEIYSHGCYNWPALMLCLKCYVKGQPWTLDGKPFEGEIDRIEHSYWDEGECDNCEAPINPSYDEREHGINA